MNAPRPSELVVVFFTLTDWTSTIPSNIRGYQSGTWSRRGVVHVRILAQVDTYDRICRGGWRRGTKKQIATCDFHQRKESYFADNCRRHL